MNLSDTKINTLYAVCFALIPGLGHYFAGMPFWGTFWFFNFSLVYAASWWVIDLLHPPTNVFAGLGILAISWTGQLIHLLYATSRKKFHTRPLVSRILCLTGGALLISILFPYIKDQWIKERWQVFEIPSDSMLPTLRKGDRVIAYMHPQITELKINDIILFMRKDKPDIFYIKRLIGKPGDDIEIRDKILYRNDTLITDGFARYIDEEIYSSQISPRDQYSIKLSADQYFVLGDNRDNSEDSRYFGPIKFEQVKAKARSLFITTDPLTERIRWERIGAKFNL